MACRRFEVCSGAVSGPELFSASVSHHDPGCVKTTLFCTAKTRGGHEIMLAIICEQIPKFSGTVCAWFAAAGRSAQRLRSDCSRFGSHEVVRPLVVAIWTLHTACAGTSTIEERGLVGYANSAERQSVHRNFKLKAW